jgi:nicotinate-nucleotide adenylyltransferase
VDVGVFGGTFDPPHVGHLVAARDALEYLGLDVVRFVPAHRSPFKREGASSGPGDRLEMVTRAVASDPALRVSRDEIERDPPSYTVDTLRRFSAGEPGTRWTLLLGADQWASFAEWREPHEIARLARIAVLTREGRDPEVMKGGVDVPIIRVPVTRLDISSSEIRERVGRGRSVRYLVPEPVRAFIESKELYAPC